MAFDDVFDLTGQSLSPSVDDTQDERLEHWLEILTQTALERKAQEGTKRKLAPSDIEALVKAVFAEVSQCNFLIRQPFTVGSFAADCLL